MTKMNVRNHSARPLSAVKPNVLVNDNSNYRPPETASKPTPNLNRPGLDVTNSRLNSINMDGECDPDVDDDCESEDGSDDDEDRLAVKHAS